MCKKINSEIKIKSKKIREEESKMIRIKTQQTVGTVRERERERVILAKICFACDAKNKINRYIKRIGFLEEVIKNKIRLFRESLSFLRACGIVDIKDKYA